MTEDTRKPTLSYTVAELSGASGFSESTIYAHLKAGTLVGHYEGRKAVIEIDDAKAWIRSRPTVPHERTTKASVV